MIKNERSASIAQKRVERLRNFLSNQPTFDDDARAKLEARAARVEISRMLEELEDYKGLKEGTVPVGTLQSLDDIPKLLIRARIQSGMTQAQLAERLGLKEQQVQRYEVTDFESISLARLREFASALELPLSASEESPPSFKVSDLKKRIRGAGLDTSFVERRFGQLVASEPTMSLSTVARLSHAMGLTPETIIEGLPVPVQAEALAHAVSYKKPTNAKKASVDSLTQYADYLVRVVLSAIPGTPASKVSIDAFRNDVGSNPSFTEVLHAAWSQGIAVIPLDEPGGFHAAIWRLPQGTAIVLNPRQNIDSVWVFDLLHEAGHVSESLDERDVYVVEMSPGRDKSFDPTIESAANDFASDILFQGRGEDYFGMVMKAARGDVKSYKRAVKLVARREGISRSTLAMNVAFRLAKKGVDWWGAANNLQEKSGDPWREARDEIVSRLDWGQVSPIDQDLMRRALAPRSIEEKV
ncbi:MAG: helix-turn-helix transcriptional regulator [Actinomycetota bacterium]